MLNCCQCPTAKISDNTLVLSLPNAMTPVVWMIDMATTGTFLMKVEGTDNGLFVLQKISDNGQKIEDIAYYSSKKKAVKAMTMITKTMNKSSMGGFWKILSLIKSVVLTAFVLVVLLFIAMVISPSLGKMILGEPTNQVVQQQTAPAQPAPTVETNPNAVGVPMSADEFLKNRGNSAFPF